MTAAYHHCPKALGAPEHAGAQNKTRRQVASMVHAVRRRRWREADKLRAEARHAEREREKLRTSLDEAQKKVPPAPPECSR